MNTIEQATAPAKVARPAGITFIGGMNLIAGVVLIIGAFSNPYGGNEAGILFIMGLISLVVAGGLLSLKCWALFIAKAGYVLNILIGLMSQNPFAVIVLVVILCYLYTDGVRAAFAPPASPALPQEADAKEV